jgi:putative DNA primase/helicase
MPRNFAVTEITKYIVNQAQGLSEVEGGKRPLAGSGVLITIRADSVKMKLIRWLWRNRVPLGALTVFFGMPDGGKSSVAIDVIFRITRGVRFPDSSAEPDEPADALMFIAEDDKNTTVVPRLTVAGADLSRVHFVTYVERNGCQKDFELDKDLDTLRATLESNPNIRLLVFDPLASYLGNVKKNAESEMRKLLHGLRNLAESTGVAVIAIDHFNKNSDQAALHRLSGTQALGAAPRAVWGFVRDPEDETKRIMMHAKLNLVADRDKSNILYSSKSVPIRIEGEDTTMPAIEWGETTKRQLDDILRSDVSEGQLERAKKMLLAQLEKDGPTFSDESDEKLTAAGFSDATVRRAKSALNNEEKIAYRKQQGKGGRFLRFIPSQLERAEGMLRVQKA